MLKIFQLLSIIHLISPELKLASHALIDQLIAEAKNTPSPADDQAMQLIAGIATIVGLY